MLIPNNATKRRTLSLKETKTSPGKHLLLLFVPLHSKNTYSQTLKSLTLIFLTLIPHLYKDSFLVGLTDIWGCRRLDQPHARQVSYRCTSVMAHKDKLLKIRTQAYRTMVATKVPFFVHKWPNKTTTSKTEAPQNLKVQHRMQKSLSLVE